MEDFTLTLKGNGFGFAACTQVSREEQILYQIHTDKKAQKTIIKLFKMINSGQFRYEKERRITERFLFWEKLLKFLGLSE